MRGMTRLRFKILPEDVAHGYDCAGCGRLFKLGETFWVPGPLCSECVATS